MSEMMTDFVALVAVASVWLLAGGIGVGMTIARKPGMPSECRARTAGSRRGWVVNRRGFLTGLLAAPAVITTPGLLMPVRAWAEQPMFVDCTFSGGTTGAYYICAATGTVVCAQTWRQLRIAPSRINMR